MESENDDLEDGERDPLLPAHQSSFYCEVLEHYQTELDLPGIPQHWSVLKVRAGDDHRSFFSSAKVAMYDWDAKPFHSELIPAGSYIKVVYRRTRTKPPMSIMRGIQILEMVDPLAFKAYSKEEISNMVGNLKSSMSTPLWRTIERPQPARRMPIRSRLRLKRWMDAKYEAIITDATAPALLAALEAKASP